MNNSGAIVYEQLTNGLSGQTQVRLPMLSKGMYFIRIVGKNTESKTVMIE
ncbi:MAG: T9SS type A sorting domain-containing protein [Chitinophagaceae bacterium]|nr:MAG: T9SS type A sorting domain-containing protein [Chitinophagaceae bacterium]